MPTPGGARPQRHLRRLPQAAHPGRRLPAVPAREGREPRGGGAPRREDGRTLAERRAAGALPGRGRPRARRGPARNNDFGYADDPRGFKCPAGAHARRANPRDALDQDGSVNVRLHRMIRRGTSYGPMLPDGVLEDDGADRGIIFVFAGAHLQAPVRVRQDPVAQRRHLHRRPGREGPARRTARRLRHLHHPAAADPPTAAGPAAVRRHPRRRVLLRPGPARPALAGGPRHMTDAHREEDDVTTHATGTDRWKALDFAPAAGRPRGTRAPRCSSTTSPATAIAVDHPEPAARRQRDQHRDGRPAHRGRRDDRGPHRRPGRRPHRRRRTGPSPSAATCASART